MPEIVSCARWYPSTGSGKPETASFQRSDRLVVAVIAPVVAVLPPAFSAVVVSLIAYCTVILGVVPDTAVTSVIKNTFLA